MTKSTITRERLEEIILDNSASLEEFMAITRMALAAMDSEPVAWTWQHLKQWHVTNDEERARDLAWDGVKVEPLYRHAQPAPAVPDDVSIFEAAIEECKTCDSIDEHAWNHGVLVVMAKYESCRAAMLQVNSVGDDGQTDDERVRYLAWDGVKVVSRYRHAKPVPVVQCPYPCGWDNLNKLAIQDAALVARGLVEGEPTTEAQRQAAISNNDRLLKVISACRAAMLQAGDAVRDLSTPVDPQVAEYKQSVMQGGSSPVIPDGYVVVPKDATLDMLKAGAKQEMKGEAFQYVWQAMLAAAPQEVK
ncbi:hypothetical protein WI984_002094 [Klebsiella aerogenes]